jgi:GTPase
VLVLVDLAALHKANANKRWHTADVAVQRRAGMGTPLEVRVAVIGNVDSGKSTVVGVLTRR